MPEDGAAPVLVAYDFDATGDAALAHGATIAERLGTRLVVLHAVDDRLGGFGRGLTGGEHGPADREELEPAAHQALAKRLTRAGAAHAEAVVRVGAAASALPEEAERTRARLLVAGVHRRSGSLLALGHTADRVAARVRQPLLLVHAEDAPPAALRRVLVAWESERGEPEAAQADAAPDSPLAAALAGGLALVAPHGAGLQVALLESTQTPALALGGEAPSRSDPSGRHRSAALAELERVAARLRAGGREVVAQESAGHLGPADLEARARAHRADLVLVARHAPGLLARLTGGVAGRAAPRLPCPLLVVPLGAAPA